MYLSSHVSAVSSSANDILRLLFLVLLFRDSDPTETGRCTGRRTGPTWLSIVLSDCGATDQEVLPFSAWSWRFTSFQGLCQSSTGSSFRRRTGHPDSAGFVRLAMRFMNLFWTRKLMPGELCTGSGLADSLSTFFGHEDGHEAGATP